MIFWVGMCCPGLQIWTSFEKEFALKMIPRCRILLSFQNPPSPFFKKETKLFLCLFDLNLDFDSKYDNFVLFYLGREARMQGKHVITRQLPYHGLRRATQ